MPEVTEEYQVRVRVEDDKEGIYIGEAGIEAIRAEANRQADGWLREGMEIWGDCDVSDLDQVKEVEFKFSMARACLATLRNLAPVPEEGD